MSFKGTLDTLGIVEVLQVIGMARKVGCLRLRGRAGELKQLFFQDGELVSATSNMPKDRLGAVLVKLGILQQAQIDAAREAESATGRRQGDMLVAAGFLTQEQLDAALGRQITEIVNSVMTWRDGSFEFVENERPAADIHLVHESVQNLILQATRQMDEWALIEKVFPSLDMVVSMKAPSGAAGADIHLHPSEWQLLTLVDGKRTIREICAASSATNFEVCRTLLNLHRAGLLATGAARPPPNLEAPPREAAPSAPVAKVPAAFVPTVREEFTRHVGPIANLILDEVEEAMGVPLAELPQSRVVELAKRLCEEIEAPEKRAHLRDVVTRAAKG